MKHVILIDDECGIAFDENVTEIIIPDDVRTIKSGSLNYINSLNSLVLPAGIDLEDETIMYCKNLRKLTLKGNLGDIGFYCFDGSVNIEEIIVPDDYSDTSGLTKFFLEGIKWFEEFDSDFVTLGKVLLDYRGSDKDVIVPDGIKYIASEAFEGDFNSITLPDSVVTIGQRAFSKCTSLTTVRLSNNLKLIGIKAFDGCKNLRDISIPESVDIIEKDAFESCVFDPIKEKTEKHHYKVTNHEIFI